jgi:hypothetical protein
MKTQVFVLVPYDVPVSKLYDFACGLLELHRFDSDYPRGKGRYDYLVGPLDKSLNDPIAEGRLPPRERRIFSGNICEMVRLPSDVIPGALVTPDSTWHDLCDFGWRMVDEPSASNNEALQRWTARYRELVEAFPHCWVLAFWSHS